MNNDINVYSLELYQILMKKIAKLPLDTRTAYINKPEIRSRLITKRSVSLFIISAELGP